jgi:serine/threonine protein kinase
LWYFLRCGTNRPPKELQQEYLRALETAVTYLNTRKVAHLDRRPENIFFRINQDEQVELKIIDFEDSVVFSRKISKAVLYPGDGFHRSPIFLERDYYASESHNNWFNVAIELWLASDANDFCDCMETNYPTVHFLFLFLSWLNSIFHLENTNSFLVFYLGGASSQNEHL